MAKKTLEDIKEIPLKKFGISREMSVLNYVLWLDTPKGEQFLKSIEAPNRNFGSYWTMHEAKSNIITQYAKYRTSLIIEN